MTIRDPNVRRLPDAEAAPIIAAFRAVWPPDEIRWPTYEQYLALELGTTVEEIAFQRRWRHALRRIHLEP